MIPQREEYSFDNRSFHIRRGPSKFDIMLALFDGSYPNHTSNGRHLEFWGYWQGCYDVPPVGPIKFYICKIERLSPISPKVERLNPDFTAWNLWGTVIFKGKKWNVKINYHTDGRTGIIEKI